MSDNAPSKNTLIDKLLLFICTAILIWAMGYIFFLSLITNQTPEPRYTGSDAVIVVTGGAGRIQTGLRLLNTGKTRNLFISGVDKRVTVTDIQAMWRDTEEPVQCCISLGDQATNTRGNAVETNQWMKDNHKLSLILVTSNYHMPRAKMEFRHSMPNMNMAFYPVNIIEQDQSFAWFLFIVFSEYNKTILTFFQHIYDITR